jgi:hypothetical protein
MPTSSSDYDKTDELPALEPTAAMRQLFATPGSTPASADDTARHRPTVGGASQEPAPLAAVQQTSALTAEMERWTARCAAAEQALADKTLLVADLDAAMAVARRSYESLKRDAEALAAELADRTRSLEASQAEAARLREELASPAKPTTPATATQAGVADSQQLREEYAALAAYVDQRRAWWERAQAEIARLATKAAALEHELAARDRLVADAQARAAREEHRAGELRAEAIAYAREVRELQRSAAAAAGSRHGEQATAGRSETRADVTRTERMLADGAAARSPLEPTLAAKDRKIAALQERLSTPVPRDTPALICLTGDAPQRVPLGRTTTFGRGAHCDVQLLTHYVSREHARIVVTGDGVAIEDLGSRNGVYVNATRVARQQLRQGDSIKIGETQFRFVESVAH